MQAWIEKHWISLACLVFGLWGGFQLIPVVQNVMHEGTITINVTNKTNFTLTSFKTQGLGDTAPRSEKEFIVASGDTRTITLPTPKKGRDVEPGAWRLVVSHIVSRGVKTADFNRKYYLREKTEEYRVALDSSRTEESIGTFTKLYAGDVINWEYTGEDISLALHAE